MVRHARLTPRERGVKGSASERRGASRGEAVSVAEYNYHQRGTKRRMSPQRVCARATSARASARTASARERMERMGGCMVSVRLEGGRAGRRHSPRAPMYSCVCVSESVIGHRDMCALRCPSGTWSLRLPVRSLSVSRLDPSFQNVE